MDSHKFRIDLIVIGIRKFKRFIGPLLLFDTNLWLNIKASFKGLPFY